MNQPKLYYSETDPGSKQVFEILQHPQNQVVLGQFAYINVSKIEPSQIPPYIRVVPSLLLEKNGQYNILTGKQLINYLVQMSEYIQKQMAQQQAGQVNYQQQMAQMQQQSGQQMSQGQFQQLNQQMNPQQQQMNQRQFNQGDLQYNANAFNNGSQQPPGRGIQGIDTRSQQGPVNINGNMQYQPINNGPSQGPAPNFESRGLPQEILNMENSMKVGELMSANCDDNGNCAPLDIYRGEFSQQLGQHVVSSNSQHIGSDGKHWTVGDLAEAKQTLPGLNQ
jgi:hypothetical protein